MVQQDKEHVRGRGELKQMRPQRHLAAEVKALPRSPRQRGRKLLLAHADDLKPGPGCLRLQDHLLRYALTLGKDGAQALMARHHIAQRSLQRRHIERPLKPQRHRDGVGGAPFSLPFQPIEEPQPALRMRERDIARARQRPKRRPRGLRLTQALRQCGNRGRLEQAADR